MQHIKRSGFSMRNQCLNVLRSSYKGLNRGPSNPVSDLGFAGFSSQALEKSAITGFSERVARHVGGNSILRGDQWARNHAMIHQSPFRLATCTGQNMRSSCFVRGFASNTTGSSRPKQSPGKEISAVEDPFDTLTDKIPQKPVTFTEGASYSLIILAGLGVAGFAAYGVLNELIFQPKEYKIFNKALNRVQNDSQVRVRIGSPITGYGSESRNRSTRQRIANKTWTDEDGVDHIMVNFHVRGPHGAGKVYSEMFQDKVDKQWKFMYLIVEVSSPTPVQLMLESYVPA